MESTSEQIIKNKYDKRYDIRLADVSDIDAIMRFIDEHWKKGHIMAVNRSFFEYEFRDGDRVNFIIAVDKKTGEIECIQGFLPCSKTDDPSKKDVWGSIWKVNDTHKNMAFLGIEVDERLPKLLNCRMGMGVGLNPKTSLIIADQVFRSKTGKMKQYYLLGDIMNPQIAVINHVPEVRNKGNYLNLDVVKLENMQELKIDFDIDSIDALPYKDSWYFEKRYFNYPIYHYDVYGVKQYGKTEAVLVTREISCNNKKVIRVIDYIGNFTLISSLGPFLHSLVDDGGYEYLDFYEFGVDDNYFLDAGMTLREDNDKNIIPNYFEPFVQQNIDIWVSYSLDGTKCFKGDSDQDRPNFV